MRHHSKWTADICVRARLSLDGRILMPPWFWRRSHDSFPVKLWIWRQLRIQRLVTTGDGATELHGLQTVFLKLCNSYFRVPRRQTSLWLVFCELWLFSTFDTKKQESSVNLNFKFIQVLTGATSKADFGSITLFIVAHCNAIDIFFVACAWCLKYDVKCKYIEYVVREIVSIPREPSSDLYCMKKAWNWG